ncbi:hypothetical protein [Humibacter albus]|uniref:hypothetical protein n=1 Tax=Humibacter albus TaxID=427754 RepID=UPI0003B6C61C|nr:hypothetical protein [Humibacter albus]
MHKRSHPHLVRTAAALALLGVVSLTGCSALFGPDARKSYLVFDDKSEAVNEDAADIPTWIPDDATDIVVDMPAQGSAYLMRFSSAAGVPVSAACSAGPNGSPLTPTIDADWWPSPAPTADRRQCGQDQAARSGHEWYVWVNAGSPDTTPTAS